MQQLQFLVDWCVQPHPQNQPRLKRVVGASLQSYASGRGAESYRWDGILSFNGTHIRKITGKFLGLLQSNMNVTHQVSVVVANTASDDAFVGLHGPTFGPEYAEDVHLDPSSSVVDDSVFAAEVRIVGSGVYYRLLMWRTYLYGG